MTSLHATFAALVLIAAAPAAEAQAFAPVGLWRSDAGRDVLLVRGPDFCSVGGTVNAAGSCGWTGTEDGGTLSLALEWTAGPRRLTLEVRWIDADTILVNGTEPFVRKG